MANAAGKQNGRDSAPAARAARPSRMPALLERLRASTATLALSLSEDGTPPKEFRLFVSGWNTTENGDYLFDESAATATMAAYAQWGVDLMIDLEHQSLDPETPPEPTAKDARGWCNLELRPDGSLWAVNATWTPDGTARLTEKRQRYVSPAFGYDADRRVTQILNVAITAMPATHNTPALMAASATSKVGKMSALPPKLIQSALEAVAAKDAKSGLVVLQQLLGSLLGGAPPDEEAPPSSANGGAPDSSIGAPTAAAGAAPGAAAGAAGDDAKKKENMAAAARVAMSLTGKTDPGEAMAELTRRSQVAVDVEAREATLSADRKALEAGERRTLVGALVKLRAELPATAWSDDKGTVPCGRLQAEPIAELRDRVAKLTAAAGASGAGDITPPAGSGDVAQGEKEFATPKGVVKLSVREQAMCVELKIKPEEYAAQKAGKKNT